MWAAQFPADGEQLFAWLLQLPEGDVLELVTFCLAASLNTQARRGNDHTGAALAAQIGVLKAGAAGKVVQISRPGSAHE